MSLRVHQQHLDDMCRRVIAGKMPMPKLIIAKVTPGGGKSLQPVILAKHFIPPFMRDMRGDRAQKILWVVPRTSLQEQAEGSFIDPNIRRVIPHDHEIRIATNIDNPSGTYSGYVTTYQALTQDSMRRNAGELARRRYILVLDEPHHIAVGSAIETAVKPLVESAVLTLAMSGTLERDDRKKIAFMPYRQHLDGDVIDLQSNERVQVIGYNRTEALRDKAIIRLFMSHVDARTEWKDKAGKVKTAESLAQDGIDEGKALWTAINTEYAKTMLAKCAADWKTFRRSNPRSKLLIVAANQKLAREYNAFMIGALKVQSGIATMDEGSTAQKTIRAFKEVGPDALNCLVTVMMAYEGLDVKAITHLCALTHIRSKPWIEQMLARATRYDPDAGPWERQFAHVFVPDDTGMRDIIDSICTSEELTVVRRGSGKPMAGFPGEPGDNNGITPMSSGFTSERESELISPVEREILTKALADAGVTHVSPAQLKSIILQAGYVKPGETRQTASVTEEKLREGIEKTVRKFARAKGKDVSAVNRRIRKVFGKSRTNMSITELQRVDEYVRKEFVVSGLF